MADQTADLGPGHRELIDRAVHVLITDFMLLLNEPQQTAARTYVDKATSLRASIGVIGTAADRTSFERMQAIARELGTLRFGMQVEIGDESNAAEKKFLFTLLRIWSEPDPDVLREEQRQGEQRVYDALVADVCGHIRGLLDPLIEQKPTMVFAADVLLDLFWENVRGFLDKLRVGDIRRNDAHTAINVLLAEIIRELKLDLRGTDLAYAVLPVSRVIGALVFKIEKGVMS